MVRGLPEEGEQKAGQGFEDGGGAIPAFSGFVGSGYVQHVGEGWKREQTPLCHTYVIPEEYIQDGVAFCMAARLVSGRGWLVVVRAVKAHVMDEQVKKDAQVVESGGQQDE